MIRRAGGLESTLARDGGGGVIMTVMGVVIGGLAGG